MVQFSLVALAAVALQTAVVTGQKLSKPAVRDSLPWPPHLAVYLHGPGWIAKQWPDGTITQRCKEMANDNKLAPNQFQVFEVLYDDCGIPWHLCRHINSPLDITQMLDRFGRVPVRMRQYSNTNIFIPQNSVSAYASGTDVCYKGNADNPWVYLHETMHTMEHSDAFNSSHSMTDQKRWLDAYNADAAVPDEYSRTSQHENIAQHSGILIFDKVYPGGLRNFDSEWPRYYRQQEALNFEGTYGKNGGKTYQIGGQTCSVRHPASPPVSAGSTSRVKRWLDARGLLSLGVVWDTIDVQRQKMKALGINMLETNLLINPLSTTPTTCSFLT